MVSLSFSLSISLSFDFDFLVRDGLDDGILGDHDAWIFGTEGFGGNRSKKFICISVYFVQVDLVSEFVRGYIWVLEKGSR